MFEIIGNVVLAILGFIALKCLVAEIMLRPATGILGASALLGSMIYQGFFESYLHRGLEYQLTTAALVVILVGFAIFQISFWKNGPFKRIAPRMFPIM